MEGVYKTEYMEFDTKSGLYRRAVCTSRLVNNRVL